MCYLKASRLCISLSLSMPSTYPTHLTILITFCEECHFFCCSLCTFVPPSVTASLWRVNILLSTLLRTFTLLCAMSCSILVRTSINNVLYIPEVNVSNNFPHSVHLYLTHVSGLFILITKLCGWNFVLLNIIFFELLIHSSALLLSYLMFEY